MTDRSAVGAGPRHRDHRARLPDPLADAGHRDPVGATAAVAAEVRRRRRPSLRRTGRHAAGGTSHGAVVLRPLRAAAPRRLRRAVPRRLSTAVARAWARWRSTCSPPSIVTSLLRHRSGYGSSASCTGRRMRCGRSRWHMRSATEPMRAVVVPAVRRLLRARWWPARWRGGCAPTTPSTPTSRTVGAPMTTPPPVRRRGPEPGRTPTTVRPAARLGRDDIGHLARRGRADRPGRRRLSHRPQDRLGHRAQGRW